MAKWLKHVDFKEFLGQQWGQRGGCALDKSFAFADPLKKWRQRKARLLARLAGIQMSLCKGSNLFLSKLETQLINEFNTIVEQEAMFLQQPKV